mgnify:CR=1 FL=1
MTTKQTILFVLSLILIGSWFIVHFLKDDRPTYKSLTSQMTFYRNTSIMIGDEAKNLIHEAERAIEKSPDQKPIVGIMHEISTILSDFYAEFDQFGSAFYQYTKGDFPFRRVYFLPIDYNKTLPVKTAIKELEVDQFNSKKTLAALEKVIFKSTESLDISQSILNEYHQKQREILKDNRVFSLLNNKKKWLASLKKQDVVHAKSQLVALRYELNYLKWQLLENTQELIQKDKNLVKEAYMIEMHTDRQPIVGKPFTMDFMLNTYINMKDLEIKLNGKKMIHKDGLATYNYTPKTAGMKRFHLEFSIKNPFTGKTDQFRNVKKVYVN